MSKADKSSVQKKADEQIATNTANSGKANEQLQSILGTASGTAGTASTGAMSTFADLASTGGTTDPTAQSTYTNLATTGGVSAEDSAAMRNRAAEAARSTYKTAESEAQRAYAATGGSGVSGSITGNLARKGSEAAEKAATSADASITGMRQTGQLAGASGLASAAQSSNANKLAAASGLSNIYGTATSSQTSTMNQILQNYAQTGQLNAQELALLSDLAKQPGWFDKMVSTISTLGGSASGLIAAISDSRVKNVIATIAHTSDDIPIVVFTYKDPNTYGSGLQIGMIAQDVEKKHPDCVFEVEGIKHINYTMLLRRLSSLCVK